MDVYKCKLYRNDGNTRYVPKFFLFVGEPLSQEKDNSRLIKVREFNLN